MKALLGFFLGLLLFTAYGVSTEHELHEKLAVVAELGTFDIDDDIDEREEFEMLSWTSGGHHGAKVLVNVDSFGASGDGVSDDTQAFKNAWSQACSTEKSVLLVPKGRSYLVNATQFKGPCSGKLTVQIDGTIIAPGEPAEWDPKFPRTWLEFSNLTSVLFQGKGVIDGSGSKWWAASCKKNKTNPCKGAPTALTIDTSSDIRVRGLTIQNSQQMHFVISHCDTVRVSSMLISSPGDSPNTDGIHLTGSTNVVILNTKIGTGDDCISIVNGSSTIKMKTIHCGPGHGVSIGSLGKNNSTDMVQKVVLTGAYIRNATNGLRIKTWQGGSGYARAIRFENVYMEDVANPIIIDQFYCDSPTPCVNLTSAVQVSQVMYRNITGTSKSKEAMKFACSDTVPCQNIVLTNIDLQKKDGSAETYCNAATGFGFGIINPSADCLTSYDKKNYSSDDSKITLFGKREEVTSFVHTEL